MKAKLFLCLTAMCLIVGVMNAQLVVTETDPVVSENFDSMYSEQNSAPTLDLPAEWRVDRHMSLPREINTWAKCSTNVMYSGGISLAANASNGTYNFTDSSNPKDCSVGGISTGGAGTVDRTKGFSILTSVTNVGTAAIDKLILSYDIEKYRKGANTAGFVAQLYTSSDGENWQSAGTDFYTFFTPDNVTEGAEIVPIDVTSLTDKTLKTDLTAGQTIYLAWNISVATGTATNAAMALAPDNVSIKAVYSSGNTSYIYIENATKQNNLQLSVNGSILTSEGNTTVNGVEYTYFAVSQTENATINISIGGSNYQISDANLNQDLYLSVSKNGVSTIADPHSYEGWTDPDRKPFKSSGIYLRGEINSWNAVAEWEFSDEGDGLYVLYDKTLSGSFKVADASWSSKCNYGSNGEQVLMDVPYQLVLGTNDNISVGGNTYKTQRIVLTISDAGAMLLLESEETDGNLQSIFVVGDFNDWNYMSASGELKLNEQTNTFEGTITLHPKQATTQSSWRLYEGLGMTGVWGYAGENGKIEKGSTTPITVEAGTYDFAVSLQNSTYTLTKHESVITSVELQPKEVILVPSAPNQVRMLSLNNSLINYNNQASVFNQLASAQGKNARWTPHSILGQPLSTHFNETGTSQNEEHQQPAKDMVRSEAWTHIILQEQSALPRNNPESFYANVRQWVEFIREECPNKNAIIILPVNWAYSGDWTNFTNYNSQFLRNYMLIARELGLVVCPVGVAYQMAYEEEGTAELTSWFQDDRHPTNKSTYLAACMEYSIVFGEDPTTLSWHTAGVSDADATKMRQYAKKAIDATRQYVNHVEGKIEYDIIVNDQFGMLLPTPDNAIWTVSAGGEITGGIFLSDKTFGDFTTTVSADNFSDNATIHVVGQTEAALPVVENDTNKPYKLFHNGIIYIVRDGKTYSILGAQTK